MTYSNSAKSNGRICYGMVWMFASPPNVYVEILNPKDDSVGDEVFGRCIDSEGWAFMNVIGVFIRGSREILCSFCRMKTCQEGTSYEPERIFTRTWPCWHLDLGFLSL